MSREASIPGKMGTAWEGGQYTVQIQFTDDYPATAPRVKFNPVIYHPNIFSSGAVCLSTLNADWKPSIGVTELLVMLQSLLTNPNPDHVTDRTEPSKVCKSKPIEYARLIRAQAERFRPRDDEEDTKIMGTNGGTVEGKTDKENKANVEEVVGQKRGRKN
jgi:ubiquitin-conjugating enzyme E2 I